MRISRVSYPFIGTIYYNFWLKDPSIGNLWHPLANESTQNWYVWSPTEPGKYTIRVLIRDSKHDVKMDDFKSKDYVILRGSALQ